MRGLQTGKAINCARNTSVSTPVARVNTHVRMKLGSREQRVKQSCEHSHEAASPMETAKSLSGLKKKPTRPSFDWRAKI